MQCANSLLGRSHFARSLSCPHQSLVYLTKSALKLHSSGLTSVEPKHGGWLYRFSSSETLDVTAHFFCSSFRLFNTTKSLP